MLFLRHQITVDLVKIKPDENSDKFACANMFRNIFNK